MTFTGWCRSWIHGWRMQRAHARSLRSLRSSTGALGLPVHRMSDDEIEASVVNFSWLSRVHGMPLEDVAAAVRRVKQAQADVRARRAQTRR